MVSDEQVMDYMFQKSKQVRLARLYMTRLTRSLNSSTKQPLPQGPVLPSLFEHLRSLPYAELFEGVRDVLGALIWVVEDGGGGGGGGGLSSRAAKGRIKELEGEDIAAIKLLEIIEN